MHSRVFFEAGLECNVRAAARARAIGADPSRFDALVIKYTAELERYDRPKASSRVQPDHIAPREDPAWLNAWLVQAAPWLQAHRNDTRDYHVRLSMRCDCLEALAAETRLIIVKRFSKNDKHIDVHFPSSASHKKAVSFILARKSVN